ncbi:MAG TPA: GFA family protein [Thermohalobaculum sp.]|nr:GFA family protein [Thermohalobaculum sp.]
MTNTGTKTGQCLCGAVKFSAEDVPHQIGACHCAQCRRWASGPYFAVAAPGLRFEGEENIGRYRSSEWAERGFCKLCGSSLFYRMIKEDRYMMAVGSFDDQSGFELSRQVFIDEKPGFYDFAQATKTSTGDDFFVRFPDLKGT